MEKTLVIGGAGFLGSHLVRSLLERGALVRVLSRSAGLGKKPEPGLEYVCGEVGDRGAIRQAVAGMQVVYDLSLGGCASLAEMQRNYIDAAYNVADACLEHRVRRLIYASSTAVLDFSLRAVIDESAGTDRKAHQVPGFYHRGKIAAEQILLERHRTRRLPVVILRPGMVMGPGGKLCHSGVGAWRDDTCCVIIGRGQHPLPFVLVQDVAKAFLLAKDAPGIEGRTFNIVGDVRPSALEFVRYLRQRSMRNFRAYRQSLVRRYVAATVKWAIKRLVGKPSDRLTWHAIAGEQVLTQINNSAAKNLLNWKPVSDTETFWRQAVDVHLRPIPIGDLRLSCAHPEGVGHLSKAISLEGS